MATAAELQHQAKDAFFDDDFALAAALCTQAIAAGPPTAALYADRAQAHIKMGDFAAAASDAALAAELDPAMHRAHLRRAQACAELGQHDAARAAAEAGAALAPGDARFAQLLKEIDAKAPKSAAAPPSKAAETAAAVTVPDSKTKYRHDFYNSVAEVVVTVFAKGVAAEHVAVEFGEQTLSVSVEVPGEAAYHLQPRLFGKIVPGECRFAVLSSKIEVRLKKAEPLTTWTSLEFVSGNKPKVAAAAAAAAPKAAQAQRPSYPSSSKQGRKDWDKIEAEVKKTEKEEKLDGDAAANKFFREIYRNADEDMRRAMMKSFVESNGTVLSTSWDEVGAKKIEASAPDGMELRKWE